MLLMFGAPSRMGVVSLILVLCVYGCGSDGRTALTLGIPTTVEDSGLLDALLPVFESNHPQYRVKFLAGGSGELLALAARGDLDALLSHSPRAEERFMEEGRGLSRRLVMENDFVLVGPGSDPAGVRGLEDAGVALAHISETEAPFLSRGDDSGTHRKELELWAEVGLSPGWSGYREAGEGMAAVLRAASGLGSYALCDRATYMNLRVTIDLHILVQGDPRLLNIYHVIVVSDARAIEAAEAFAGWLTSEEGRHEIAAYGVERFGTSLFRPAEAKSGPARQ
jgi:tungstate transport system substrate-binding protein